MTEIDVGYSEANVTIIEEKRNLKTYVPSPQMLHEMKESFVHYLRSHPDFVKEIFNEALCPADAEEVTLVKIDKNIAKQKIQNFIENNIGCRTSDIINNLGLEPMLVLEILKELKDANLVHDKPVGQ